MMTALSRLVAAVVCLVAVATVNGQTLTTYSLRLEDTLRTGAALNTITLLPPQADGFRHNYTLVMPDKSPSSGQHHLIKVDTNGQIGDLVNGVNGTYLLATGTTFAAADPAWLPLVERRWILAGNGGFEKSFQGNGLEGVGARLGTRGGHDLVLVQNNLQVGRFHRTSTDSISVTLGWWENTASIGAVVAGGGSAGLPNRARGLGSLTVGGNGLLVDESSVYSAAVTGGTLVNSRYSFAGTGTMTGADYSVVLRSGTLDGGVAGGPSSLMYAFSGGGTTRSTLDTMRFTAQYGGLIENSSYSIAPFGDIIRSAEPGSSHNVAKSANIIGPVRSSAALEGSGDRITGSATAVVRASATVDNATILASLPVDASFALASSNATESQILGGVGNAALKGGRSGLAADSANLVLDRGRIDDAGTVSSSVGVGPSSTLGSGGIVRSSAAIAYLGSVKLESVTDMTANSVVVNGGGDVVVDARESAVIGILADTIATPGRSGNVHLFSAGSRISGTSEDAVTLRSTNLHLRDAVNTVAFMGSNTTIESDHSLVVGATTGGTITLDSSVVLQGNFLVGSANGAASGVRFYERGTSGTDYVELQAPSITANQTYRLPSTAPVAGRALTASTTATSQMAWSTLPILTPVRGRVATNGAVNQVIAEPAVTADRPIVATYEGAGGFISIVVFNRVPGVSFEVAFDAAPPVGSFINYMVIP